MSEVSVLETSTKLESAKVAYTLTSPTEKDWQKSGDEGWNAFVLGKKILLINDPDQSVRKRIVDPTKRTRFGFCSISQKAPDTGLRSGWELIPASSETVIFSDDFSTDQGTPDYDTAKWDVLGSPTSIVVSGGELTITQSSTGGLKSDSTFSLAGKAVQVKVPIVESNANLTNGFILAPDDSLASYIAFDEYNGNLRFAVAGSGNSASLSTITYNGTNHLFLRVRFAASGNTIYFETSPDGTVWTERATGTYTQSKTLRLYLRNFVSAAGKVSKFDAIKISTPPTASAYKVVENGEYVYTADVTPDEDDELRVRWVVESGNLVAKYYWRDSTEDDEILKHTSTLTNANLLSYFPVLVKGEIFSDGGILRNLQIESSEALDTFSYKGGNNAPESSSYPLIFHGATGNEGGKELPNHELIYKGATLNTAQQGLLVFRAMEDWTQINSVKVSVLEANELGACRFNLRHNGANIFDDELELAAGETVIKLTDLSIEVTEDDVFILDYVTTGRKVIAPIILELGLE